MAETKTEHSFIVMANRLPVDWCEGAWQAAPGGLVSALAPMVKAERGAWLGWAGGFDETVAPFEFDQMSLVPVPLTQAEHRAYYEGFSNGVLWPLYHDLIVAPQYHRTWWRAYEAINSRFAQATLRSAAYGATIWVHDYHLQLVPHMVRLLRPDVRIGFFNHIPFPPVELFGQMPWRREVVTGLLGADVIGFQRSTDAENFREAVRTFAADADSPPPLIDAFPISVDTDAIRKAAESETVARKASQIRCDLGDPDILMLGIDRLDYTKGIPHRLRAFDELLADDLLSPKTTSFLQVAVPSREGIAAYQDLRDEVERLVGRINGRFATLGRGIVQYSHHSYSFEDTVALYLAADVLVVSSLRDGMNLVAKEFVTARKNQGGALVLSEFADAADELEQAIIVNPHDISGLKNGMHQAASLDVARARERIASMATTVEDRDVHHWAQKFLAALQPASPLGPASGTTATEHRDRTPQKVTSF
ncbi:alpha,alpha-trehalose-phosphate synthase (UDP-forming) [Brevibacterium sp. CFH 10365]|uniref:alpha,alpha-trehalose-phosphate synthase (UDP-forming) n=1 Tax=Brevibacterium sp. CFH 10365 TaxID=2585207 RepID=UPI0012663819|nr:trehalose-6-phosphate synthase [Brevibacterium sp. CFH 10365]